MNHPHKLPGHTVNDFWRANAVPFPVLAQIARKYLSIDSTSCETERVFSKSGYLINKLRTTMRRSQQSCLSPQTKRSTSWLKSFPPRPPPRHAEMASPARCRRHVARASRGPRSIRKFDFNAIHKLLTFKVVVMSMHQVIESSFLHPQNAAKS